MFGIGDMAFEFLKKKDTDKLYFYNKKRNLTEDETITLDFLKIALLEDEKKRINIL